MTEIAIIYHDPCPDGLAAAWITFQELNPYGHRIRMIPTGYDTNPPDLPSETNIWIVDFSYPPDVLAELAAKHERVIVLDHHATAAEALGGTEGLPALGADGTIDVDRSGAGIAWDWWHPTLPRPWWVDYVEDRDLWRWALPDSRAINAWIGCHHLTFDLFFLWGEAEVVPDEIMVEAGGALRMLNATVARQARYARSCEIGGDVMPVVNATAHMSETTEEVLILHDATLAAYFTHNGTAWNYGFRSIDGSARAVAERLGGGGHPNAAGCKSTEQLHHIITP